MAGTLAPSAYLPTIQDNTYSAAANPLPPTNLSSLSKSATYGIPGMPSAMRVPCHLGNNVLPPLTTLPDVSTMLPNCFPAHSMPAGHEVYATASAIPQKHQDSAAVVCQEHDSSTESDDSDPAALVEDALLGELFFHCEGNTDKVWHAL